MTRTSASTVTLAAAVLAGVTLALEQRVTARQPGNVAVDKDDLGGVVTSAKGPEAGVWVIAETTDLPTKFAKIVVTDDRGRYLMPDCRRSNTASGCAATAWSIRRRSQASPGTTLNLTAVIAPNADAPRPSTTRPDTGSR